MCGRDTRKKEVKGSGIWYRFSNSLVTAVNLALNVFVPMGISYTLCLNHECHSLNLLWQPKTPWALFSSCRIQVISTEAHGSYTKDCESERKRGKSHPTQSRFRFLCRSVTAYFNGNNQQSPHIHIIENFLSILSEENLARGCQVGHTSHKKGNETCSPYGRMMSIVQRHRKQSGNLFFTDTHFLSASLILI